MWNRRRGGRDLIITFELITGLEGVDKKRLPVRDDGSTREHEYKIRSLKCKEIEVPKFHQ